MFYLRSDWNCFILMASSFQSIPKRENLVIVCEVTNVYQDLCIIQQDTEEHVISSGMPQIQQFICLNKCWYFPINTEHFSLR